MSKSNLLKLHFYSLHFIYFKIFKRSIKDRVNIKYQLRSTRLHLSLILQNQQSRDVQLKDTLQKAILEKVLFNEVFWSSQNPQQRPSFP